MDLSRQVVPEDHNVVYPTEKSAGYKRQLFLELD